VKTFLVIVVLLLLGVLAFFANKYYEARTDRRAQFLEVRVWLKEAHFDHEGYTNDFIGLTEVYPYTNRFTIDGTNYVCEFAARSELFRDRGFLAVTTNLVYVWVDKKGGVVPLEPGLHYAPGF
jgi:hypothetical protein